MQVMDNVSWAFHCAHTTAQTYGFLDHCTVVFYFYRTGCAGLLADSAADTADVTLLLCFCTFFLIGTFYHNVVCTLMDMDHFLWADFRTGATANAFLLIHFRHTILIDGNGSEFTFIYSGSTADTAFTASCFPLDCPASTIAGNNGCLIWKFLFDCHINPSFRMVCSQAGDCICGFRHSGNMHLRSPVR